MIKLNINENEHRPMFSYGTSEFNDYVRECADKLPEVPNERDTVIIRNTIYKISNNAFIDVYVVDANWGRCGRYYVGSLYDAVEMFLKDGGDVSLVTFTDAEGNTYTPNKKNRKILVTTTTGDEFYVSRAEAERNLRGIK